MSDGHYYDFYNRTCGECVYFYDWHHVQKPICRCWPPDATSYNAPAMVRHVEADRPACGQFEVNPYKGAESG